VVERDISATLKPEPSRRDVSRPERGTTSRKSSAVVLRAGPSLPWIGRASSLGRLPGTIEAGDAAPVLLAGAAANTSALGAHEPRVMKISGPVITQIVAVALRERLEPARIGAAPGLRKRVKAEGLTAARARQQRAFCSSVPHCERDYALEAFETRDDPADVRSSAFPELLDDERYGGPSYRPMPPCAS